MGKLAWTRERILTFDAEGSCGALAAAIAANEPDFVVLRSLRGAFYYVFRTGELRHAIEAAPLAARVDATLTLKEEESSRRADPGEYVTDAVAAAGLPATAWRAVRVEGGRAVAVAEPELHAAAVAVRGWPENHLPATGGSAPPAAGEGTDIVRYPSVRADGEVRPAAALRIEVDLASQPGASTAGPAIPFSDLPGDWSELPISVRVASSHLSFPDGDEGVVLIRRGQPSIPYRLRAEVTAELPPSGHIEIRASFRHRNRFCGDARCLVAIAGAPVAPAPPSPTTAVVVPPDAEGPVLTVNIYRERTMPPDSLFWTIDVNDSLRSLVRVRTSGSVTLSGAGSPGQFVQGLFKAAAGCPPGMHVARLQGIGERLWDMAPECFRTIYWLLRDQLGDDFPIQLVVDDPWIPWELMRPRRDGAGGLKLLAETHPIGRGFQDYPDQMRHRLPAGGKVVTIAPAYHMRPQLGALPSAQEESAELQARFSAEAIEPRAGRLLMLLADTSQAVSVLHFAGHGGFDPAQVQSSILALDDGDVMVHDVRRQETMLGEKFGTLLILNACEVGATGDVQGTIGGWAEAFAYRRFGGVIAPLWAVDDEHARNAVVTLLGLVLNEKETIGRALMRVRREFGALAPTYASYIYFGDVNARFA